MSEHRFPNKQQGKLSTCPRFDSSLQAAGMVSCHRKKGDESFLHLDIAISCSEKKKKKYIYIEDQKKSKNSHKLNFSSTYRQKIYTFESHFIRYTDRKKKEAWANIRTDEWQNKE